MSIQGQEWLQERKVESERSLIIFLMADVPSLYLSVVRVQPERSDMTLGNRTMKSYL
jgi:hypothetical protein